MAELLIILPKVPPDAGANFFGLVAITLGTLVAATVSDATARQANLRSAAVAEVTMMKTLVRELEAELSGNNNTQEETALLKDCFTHLWGHTTMVICGSRGDELKSIADGSDYAAKLFATLQRARANHSEQISLALDHSQRILEMRGRRLSLENAGVPLIQINYLRAESVAISIIFAYLSLDYDMMRVGPILYQDKSFLTATFEPRTLFSLLIATLSFASDLCDDLNKPFQGYFRIDSGTLWATMVQVREVMATHLGRAPDEDLYERPDMPGMRALDRGL